MNHFNIIGLTADIAASFVSNNTIATSDVPGLISAIYGALKVCDTPVETKLECKREPAVSIRKSLSNPEVIISMIDGKPYKMLKRHLGLNGMTPDQYRAEFGLPSDYPMTAPAYSETRRNLAVKIGLGHLR